MGRNGGPGQPTAVFIRGAESNHTLVLIDGIRVNPGTIGLPALQNIPPDYDRAHRDHQGPRSALWGTDAIGGVINVITRRGSREGWSTEVGYGDYDTRKASVNGGFDVGSTLGIDFGVSWIDSEGFPTRTFDDVDRGYDNLSENLQARFDVGPAQLAFRTGVPRAIPNTRIFSSRRSTRISNRRRLPPKSRFPCSRGQCRVTLSHFEDRIDQNQSTISCARTATRSMASSTGRPTRPTRSASARWFRARKGAQRIVRRPDVRRHRHDHGLRAGPHQRRPPARLLALGYTDHETAGERVTWNLDYAFDFTPQAACLRTRPAAAFARRTRPIASASAATRTSIPRVRTITRPACATR
jgi:vitamin B12 transporter